ncbi:MAG: hypothetical protein K0S32_238 [Bacteroidetes bacterium]|jgi:hypothetical protein|nr:hypothetical protein [Bacteroidota bacterium]
MAFNNTLFYLYTLDERIEIINHRGEFITRIKYYGFYLNLYIVDNRLIEVYHNIQTNTIDQVELLESTDERLCLYSVNVNLSDLFTA